MSCLEALKNICNGCEKKMAINKTRCPFRSISNEYCEEYELIKKDLEILEIFKKHISIRIESLSMGNVRIKNESIRYNGIDLDITNEEEYNKIKDWILK